MSCFIIIIKKSNVFNRANSEITTYTKIVFYNGKRVTYIHYNYLEDTTKPS